MTIERMSYPKGHIIENAMEINALVMKEKDTFVELEEGEYEISPPYLKRRFKYSRTLSVNNKGSARLSESENPHPEFESTNVINSSGRVYLANPGEVFIVVGPGNKREKAYLYEVLRYRPNKIRK